MMKSFFKKLAFVMALAMVVSMVTPAGAVFAADAAGIALQTAKSDAEILESDNIAVGATVDYKFYGCANWKTRGLKWTSSNEAVATVDQTGKITGVADGVATIDLKSADGSYAVSLKVVVGKGDMTYTYKQISHNTAAFIFKQDVDFKKSDVSFYKVFDGGFVVEWDIESIDCDKNVAAIVSDIDFEDGDTYIIKFGADDQGMEFTTTLGDVDDIQISWKSLDKDGTAYAKRTEDDEDIEVTLEAKLLSNGVDVTEVYNVEDVEFELVNESEDYDLDDNILVFNKHSVVAEVRAIYEYETDDEEDKVADGTAKILSIPAPKYKIDVVEWTIADSSDEDLEIDWSESAQHSVKDGDEDDHCIVLLMQDSYGNLVVYPDAFADKSELGDETILSLDELINGVDTEDKKFEGIDAAKTYNVRYESRTLNALFVGTTTGELTTIADGKASVLVSLYGEDEDGEDVLVKTLGVAKVEVKEARRPDKITAKPYADKLLVDPTNVVAGDDNNHFEQIRYKFTVTDQYGDEFPGARVVLTEDSDKIDVEITTSKTDSDGVVKQYIDGDDFIYDKETKKNGVVVKVPTAVDSVKFTATVKDYDKVKTTFTIKTETPKVKDGALEISGWELAADDIDVYLEEAKSSASSTRVSGSVILYQISNGMRVGYETSATLLFNGDSRIEDGEFAVKSGDTTEDAIYVVVYDTDGEALAQATTDDNGVCTLGVYKSSSDPVGKFTVNAARTNVATDTSLMAYLDNGTYTAVAYRVKKTYDDPAKDASLSPITETFSISNSTEKVTLKEQEYKNLTEADGTFETIEEVIFGAFKFKLGDDSLTESGAKVLDAKTKFNEDSKELFVYHVTFAVPLNNDDDTIYFKAKEVAVNKAVKVGEEFTNELN